MHLEVGAPGRRLLGRRARDGPARAAVEPVDEMDDEGERGHETAVLREVRDDHGMVIVAAELRLELRPPGAELTRQRRAGGEDGSRPRRRSGSQNEMAATFELDLELRDDFVALVAGRSGPTIARQSPRRTRSSWIEVLDGG